MSAKLPLAMMAARLVTPEPPAARPEHHQVPVGFGGRLRGLVSRLRERRVHRPVLITPRTDP